MLSIKFLIVSLADAYSMVLFVYVLMSWFPTDRGILADINRVPVSYTHLTLPTILLV